MLCGQPRGCLRDRPQHRPDVGPAPPRASRVLGAFFPIDSPDVYVYGYRMPQLTIYVDQQLHDKIRTHKIPLSLTCQRALARQVRTAERRAGIIPGYTRADDLRNDSDTGR